LYFINADGKVARKMEVEVSDINLQAGFNYLKWHADPIAVQPLSKEN
jgi:hypothetical protein